MRNILLNFTNPQFVDALLGDTDFMTQAQYLNPRRLSPVRIGFSDPVQSHSAHNTEDIVLTICGIAIKRLCFGQFDGEVEYLTPYIGSQKGGIRIQKTIIVDSTEVQQ